MLDEAYKIFLDIFGKIKKSKTKPKKFFKTLVFIILLVIVVSVIFQNMVLSEMRTQSEIIKDISLTDTNNLDYEMQIKYNELVETVKDNGLPYTSIKNYINSFLFGVSDIWENNAAKNISFIGFGFKYDVFITVLTRQLIPFIIYSVIVIIVCILANIDNYKERKFIKGIIYAILGFIITEFVLFLLLSFVCFIISILTFLMIVSSEITIWISTSIVWIFQVVLIIIGFKRTVMA